MALDQTYVSKMAALGITEIQPQAERSAKVHRGKYSRVQFLNLAYWLHSLSITMPTCFVQRGWHWTKISSYQDLSLYEVLAINAVTL